MTTVVEFDLDELRAVHRSMSTSADALLRKLQSVGPEHRVYDDALTLYESTDSVLTKVRDALAEVLDLVEDE